MGDKQKKMSERARALGRKYGDYSRRPLALQDTSDAWNERQRRLSSGLMSADFHIKASEYKAIERMREVLEQNKDKEFVRRVLDPDNSPKMDLGKGHHGTHLMAAEIDPETGNWLVFPTIVNINGGLHKLEVNQAYQHAKQTGEYINFGDNKRQALNFSKHYKKTWDKRFKAQFDEQYGGT